MDSINNTTTTTVSKPLMALILLLWARYPIWEYISGALSHVPVFSTLGETSIAIIVGFLILLSIKEIFLSINKGNIFFFLTIVGLYFLSYAIHPENQAWLDERYTISFTLTVLPYFFYGLILDINRDKGYLLYISYASVLFQFLYIFLLGKGGVVGNAADDMIGYAYNLLPHVVLISYGLLEKRTALNFIFFAMGFLLLISMANRGSIVCFLSFFVLYFVLFKYKTAKVSYKMTFIVLGVFVAVSFDYIILFLYNIMSRLNLNTRVLDFVLSANFAASEGREEIYEVLMNEIRKSPTTMHGIGGDHQFVSNYAHNILVEWWIAFGVIIGSVLMLGLVSYLFKAYRKSPKDSQVFLLILITCGFENLFLSSTFLNQPLFFMMIGYATNCIRRARIENFNK